MLLEPAEVVAVIPMIQTTNLETTVIIIPDMVVMVTIPRGVRDGTLEREVPGVLILRRTVMTNMVLQGILRITDLRMGAAPTEVMTAISAGADALKLFPAELIGLAGLNAIKAVIPEGTLLIPVGGIDEDNYRPYLLAGAIACGLGSSLYKAGISRDKLKDRAEKFRSRWKVDKESLSVGL